MICILTLSVPLFSKLAEEPRQQDVDVLDVRILPLQSENALDEGEEGLLEQGWRLAHEQDERALHYVGDCGGICVGA